MVTDTLERQPKQEATTLNIDPTLEPIVNALNAMNPENRELISIMVRQLAEREGISMAIGEGQGLKTPAEGIPMWIAKMKQEGYSRNTIRTYLQTIESYLKRDPVPTRLSIQQWMATRLEQVSTARVSMDLKALKSLFSFLHEEHLWSSNPTLKMKNVKVAYRSRECPTTEEIDALLGYQCLRKKDTVKFQFMILLLATTGLRISEAASILKDSINLDSHEVKVIGKGNKEGIIPLLPITCEAITTYMVHSPSNSPFLFPGDTELGYWSICSFEKALRHACAKLGIRQTTPHQLRHFFATFMLKGGAKLEVVSKLLRHASVAITADVYRHVMSKELHETTLEFAPLANGRRLALPEGQAVEGEAKEVD